MIIRWSGFSAYYCVVLPSLESLDWRLMFTHSTQVNGECLVLLHPCLLYGVYFVMSDRHLPMGRCIGLLSEMITNSLFWCSIWEMRSSTKFCYRNFQVTQGGWCGLVFLYMEIPLLGFKVG